MLKILVIVAVVLLAVIGELMINDPDWLPFAFTVAIFTLPFELTKYP